jgi:outer membrane protein
VKTSSSMKFILLSLLIAAIAVFSGTVYGQVKIGYVNSETIIKELPEAKDAKAKLEGIVKGWQDEMERMSKALQDKYEEYQKQKAMLNDATRQTREKSLVEEEQKINQYRQEKFGQQGEYALQQEKIMTPIREKILRSIEQVAKEEKVSFMFDKAGDVLLLYADKTADYTYKVLDRLKRGK